jgi:hypothetical protein
MSGSVSGLTEKQRNICRGALTQAAWLCYDRRDNVHYTQGPRRWDGINRHLVARKGQYPTQADCSSFATWCLWNGLYIVFNKRDLVNGAAWKAGFTGTMLGHGKPVNHKENWLRGDCVIYGSGYPGKHVAIIVNTTKQSQPMVISHGSEGGPYYLPYNYRSDIMEVRRYI